MPQINRIRVNNVKYNFGTQYYDDFFMRFSCKNSLYDLANGGGKSVLMLLLLQNLIPNCTLDDKQPVEKLFRKGNDNTVIHSLVEWKLDACDVRNGYRYMTTGFCARRAKENAESDSTETANIEYFNYCIFYREFGENDIKNLPLSNGRERVTYNGLKAYLRELEKRDFNVEVKIFDRKGDYQNFISDYGLYESQWEIVRGINKTEGHVRTYFESNYKTTRKVVEDLLIEGIIEKSYNNKIRKGEEDDLQMAKTLLDIKSKIIELAGRREEINNYDEQIRLLNAFADRLEGFKALFGEKKEFEDEIVLQLLSCRKMLASKKQAKEELLLKKENYAKNLDETKRLGALAEIEIEQAELDKIEALILDTSEHRALLMKKKEKLTKEAELNEAAAHYFEYLECKKKYDELLQLIKNSGSSKSDIADRLKKLAATKYIFYNKGIKELEQKLLTVSEELKKADLDEEKNKADTLDKYGVLKKTEALIDDIKCEIDRINSETQELTKEVMIAASAQAETRLEEINQEIEKGKKSVKDFEELFSKEEENLNITAQKIMETDAGLTLTGEEIDRLNEAYGKVQSDYEKLENLKHVYSENDSKNLISKIERVFNADKAGLIKEKEYCDNLNKYLSALHKGEMPEYGEYYNNILEYLKKRYDDVVSGKEWLLTMEESRRAEIFSQAPQLLYAVFAEESYESIQEDDNIRRLNTGSYIIPVLKKSEMEKNSSGIIGTGAFFDYSFINDASGTAAEITKVTDELQKHSDMLKRLEDRQEVVMNDYFEAKYLSNGENPEELKNKLSMAREHYEELSSNKEKYVEDRENCRLRADKCKSGLESAKDALEKLFETKSVIEKILEKNEILNDKYARLRIFEKNHTAYSRDYNALTAQGEKLKDDILALEKEKSAVSGQLEAIKLDFDRNYKIFYSEETEPYEGMSEEETDAQAGALRELFNKEQVNLKDKEDLLQNYEASMKKSIDNLKYCSFTPQEAKEAYEKGLLKVAGLEERLELKNEIAIVMREIEKVEETYNSEQTQKSRIEGSIWHGKKLFEEKYGEYAREEINNPQAFVVANRQQLSEITQKMLCIDKEIKALEEADRDFYVLEKDLMRIIKNAGIEIPDDAKLPENIQGELISASKFEELERRYDRIRKEENRRKSIFTEEKQKLSESLFAIKAYELAEEIRHNVTVPESIGEVGNLLKGLSDTNDCIALERDNIEQSISDMQKIKDSFEERCVQICSNIKSELERLPKLSKITLDNEPVSMITLQIPYVREEMIKDRMSVFINEVVSCADTIDGEEEKLKYIRTQLSWKKLFSVIVTDMNSIKLCLYKREHIKDQSRYLRYEEAVGSTGQSQGIYIQFLIAVINYISSINSAGNTDGVSGKTIFIDNPFGAAKDVYIWEPIFKLLKTNHVQLIVPARGATPAISRMFDVNYILGQKMVGSRQQTVVVDYRSQVETDEMDYQVMEFEQATLNLD